MKIEEVLNGPREKAKSRELTWKERNELGFEHYKRATQHIKQKTTFWRKSPERRKRGRRLTYAKGTRHIKFKKLS